MGWQFYSYLGRRRGEMVNQSIQEEILNQLDKLPIEQQAQVLDFARALTKPEGRQGKDLLYFAGGINIDDLSLMTEAIERDCEQVNADDW